ncbi:MAG: hypothetical protein U1F10_04245 [Burkholderiales bacterium]
MSLPPAPMEVRTVADPAAAQQSAQFIAAWRRAARSPNAADSSSR